MKSLQFANPTVQLIYDILAHAIEEDARLITISYRKLGVFVEYDRRKEKDDSKKLPRRMWPGLYALLWIFSKRYRFGVFSSTDLNNWHVQLYHRSKRLLSKELGVVTENINRMFST